MKNILLAVDLKSTDSFLLEQAAVYAAKFQSKIWIVHVAAPDPDFVGYSVGPTYIRTARAEELRKEHRLIKQMTDQFRKQDLEAEGLLIQGATIEMLEREVVKLNIDFLIIGSHRHGFLYENFVGSTEIKLVKKIKIPVLIVPLPE